MISAQLQAAAADDTEEKDWSHHKGFHRDLYSLFFSDGAQGQSRGQGRATVPMIVPIIVQVQGWNKGREPMGIWKIQREIKGADLNTDNSSAENCNVLVNNKSDSTWKRALCFSFLCHGRGSSAAPSFLLC